MSTKHDIIRLRRGTASEWAASLPQPGGEVLRLGEPGYEKDTGKLKIGDGVNGWNNLSYFAGGLNDIPENVQDIVGSGFLVAGTGIIVDYNDEDDSLTISASGTFDAAVPWTANHTLVDGTRYLINDLVYESGRLYKANYDNESLPVSNTTYWTDVGPGYRLNIDGRDIPNIPYPVDNILSGTGISVTSVDGTFTITSTGSGILADQASALVTTVFNKTGSPIPKMTAVYIDGGQGDQPTVELAVATGDATSAGTYGVTYEAIPNMQVGKVIVFGALTGLDTDQFNPTAPTGDVNGTVLYLSPTTPGALTTTKPSAPNHIVAIGTIVRTHQNEGVIEIRIQNGFELEELHNVAISGASDNDMLLYNSASGLWENVGYDLEIFDHGVISAEGTVNYNINWDVNQQIQKMSLPSGISMIYNTGTGWPSSDINRDVLLWLNVTSSTGVPITWNIVGSNWYNQPPSGPLASGEHMFVLRGMGSGIIQGHYIGNKTGSI